MIQEGILTLRPIDPGNGRSLDQSVEESESPLGSLVIFSDGRNTLGRNLLEVGNEYRSRGIPINVIGVGKDQPQGDLRISFSDRNPRALGLRSEKEILKSPCG